MSDAGPTFPELLPCSHPALCDSCSLPMAWPQAPTNHMWPAGWPISVSFNGGGGQHGPRHACQHCGGEKTNHSHQFVTTYGGGGLLIGVSPPGSPGGTPEVYQPSAAKSLQQQFMVPVETMQRTQSPSQIQVSVGPSEMTNKMASGLLRATTVSSLTQPQTPKAPKPNRTFCCLDPWLLVVSGHSKVRRL